MLFIAVILLEYILVSNYNAHAYRGIYLDLFVFKFIELTTLLGKPLLHVPKYIQVTLVATHPGSNLHVHMINVYVHFYFNRL